MGLFVRKPAKPAENFGYFPDVSSGIPSLTILTEEQRFNRENLLQWKMNITQLLGLKGLLGYIDGTTQKPTQPTTSEKEPATGTAIYLTHPTFDEWVFWD